MNNIIKSKVKYNFKKEPHKNTSKKFNRDDYNYIKKFNNGKHAEFVILLKHKKEKSYIIKKKYKKEHADIFLNELQTLKKIRNCNFVPKILKSNLQTLSFYMSYCGEPVTNLAEYKTTIRKYQEILKNRYGIYHNDIKKGNICLLEKKIYLIDFGWASNQSLKAGYGRGKAGYTGK